MSKPGTGLSVLKGAQWAPDTWMRMAGRGQGSTSPWGDRVGEHILRGRSTFSEQAPQTPASGWPEDGGQGPRAVRRVGTLKAATRSVQMRNCGPRTPGDMAWEVQDNI